MTRVPDSKIYDSNIIPVEPYGGVGRNESIFPNQREFQGSDLLISPYVSLTAAHVVSNDLILGDVTPSFFISYLGSIPNGSGGYNNFFGSIIANDYKFSTTYSTSSPKIAEV